MNTQRIMDQSKSAYKQWAEQWREHAKAHHGTSSTSFEKFENIGVGKAVLCVANGYTFEEEIEVIKKHQKNVDILACDKTMGHLLDNGIKPTFVMVCDANVDYEKYMEKWKDQLQDTTLFINACANPKWSKNGNWKDIVVFVNKDIIESEKEFCELSGTQNVLPAGTNVSNAMVILLTQSDNTARNNLFGYDKILLIGFDYSWRNGGKYYAFDEDGGGKSSYMRHAFLITPSGEFCYSSGNLIFSMDWLTAYINAFNLPVVQCGKHSLLRTRANGELEKQMQYSHRPEDRHEVRSAVEELKKLAARTQQLSNKVNNIGRDHYWSFVRTI